MKMAGKSEARRYPIRDTDKDGINMCLYKNLHNPYSETYNRYFRLLCLDKKRQMRATFLPTFLLNSTSCLTSYHLSRSPFSFKIRETAM